MVLRGQLLNRSGFTLVEVGAALASAIILILATQKIVTSISYQSQKASLKVQEQVARSLLRSVVRTDGCNATIQGPSGTGTLPIDVSPLGAGFLYTIASGYPVAFTRGPTTGLTPVSNINFSPYTLVGQSISLDRCRKLQGAGQPPVDCGGVGLAGNVVFEARFRLVLQFGSGLGAETKTIEEVTSVFGKSDGTSLTLTGCRPSGVTGTITAIDAEQFCHLLGPGGNPSGVAPPNSPASAGMFRPKFESGKCNLRPRIGADIFGGPLAYAVGSGDGNFSNFKIGMLGLPNPIGCRVNPLDPRLTIGFTRSTAPLPGGRDPYNCRDPGAPSIACSVAQPNCVRKWSDNCVSSFTTGTFDSGFRLEHSDASSGTGFTTNSPSCMGFTFQTPSGAGVTTNYPGVCGKHCN